MTNLPPFARPPLNDWLLGELTTTALPVSLGVGPARRGWVDASGNPAEPNTPGASFAGYAVLTPGSASQHFRATLGDDTGSWSQPYSLLTVGGLAQQPEDDAAGLRVLVEAIAKQKLDLGGPWTMTHIEVTTMGALVRSDVVNPPVWQIGDTITVWLDRARSL